MHTNYELAQVLTWTSSVAPNRLPLLPLCSPGVATPSYAVVIP